MSNFISIDKLYYAVQTKDDETGATYSTPKPLGAAVQISADPTVASGSFYGDGFLKEQAYMVTDAKVSVETESLPIEIYAELLGHELDSQGGMTFGKFDQAPYVCLMYRRQKVNGHYRYIKLLKVKFQDIKDDGSTVNNSVKIQDETLDGSAITRIFDGQWKAIKDEDAEGYTDVSTSWFASV
ncbi:major tail protein [Clostridium pasteurianum]|uniref:Phage major tail protein, phi13 family n=1 Tax=Clostridium pasteurianum BC1 TaxID=86416 RepID=R4K2J3_CLOPA|nr:major tail protein [Clostridium pasteurianum]AGK96803.1 phage major tail protein, phi13 family [Clostridium pasteurianum BC1]